MNRKSFAVAALVVTSALGGAALHRFAVAQDAAPAHKLACPTCAKIPDDKAAEKCPKDDVKLVRSDLIVLHALVLDIGKMPTEVPGGLENPFKACMKGSDVDADALEKLVHDYKEAAKTTKFTAVRIGGGGGGEGRTRGNEAAAIGALKTINTCQAIFREGDKDQNGELDYGDLKALAKADLVDKVLGTGKKQGYLFTCAPSTETKEFLWYATAFPEKPGETGDRFFFTNQAGVIFYGKAAFKVDAKKCDVPEGLLPVGK